MKLPTDAKARKAIPIVTGCFDYFPDALLAVAELSRIGNDQHNPGQPLHWSRDKSNDHADCLGRHFIERGTVDTDKVLHSVKVAWRALAIAQLELEQLELEADVASPPPRAWDARRHAQAELRWQQLSTDGQPARYLTSRWDAFSTDGQPLNPEKRIGPDRRIHFTQKRAPHQFRRARGHDRRRAVREKRIGPDRRIHFTPIEERGGHQFRRATGLGTGRRCPT